MIELRLFGSIELRDHRGKEISRVLSQPKRLAVLAYLAAATPRGYHRRDKIVGLLWPEMDQSQARAALRRALHFLRKFLGRNAILSRGTEEVGFNQRELWCDTSAFERALGMGKEEEAVQLYRGDLLSGFFLHDSPGFGFWLEEEQAVRREAAVAAMWEVAHRYVESGRVTEGEFFAKRALSLACSSEKEVRRFMSALTAAGDRAAALRFYDKFCEGLRAVLDLEPSPDSKTLAHALRGRPGDQSL